MDIFRIFEFMNKKFFKFFNITHCIIALVGIVLIFSACKKYEDGPIFSMRFKSTRIANEWVFSKLTIDGTDHLDSVDYLNSGVYVVFSKGGDYKIVVEDPDSVSILDSVFIKNDTSWIPNPDTSSSIDTVIKLEPEY